MTTVQFVNTDNYPTSTEVEAHNPYCSHLKNYRNYPFIWVEADAGTGEYETAQEAWSDYNADFLEEGSDTWPLTVFPCTGLVERTTTINGG